MTSNIAFSIWIQNMKPMPGDWYKDLSISMPNLLLLSRKNSFPVISKVGYLTDLRV